MTDVSFLFQTIMSAADAKAIESYFNNRVKEEISNVFSGLLQDVQRLSGQPFGTIISWDLTNAERTGMFSSRLQPNSVVIYFVRDDTKSLIKRAGVNTPADAGGLTATTPAGHRLPNGAISPGGVISEVYVDGNLPAGKLARIAFHEMMHNKLDVGTGQIGDIHQSSIGGDGLAVSPIQGWEKVTLKNATLLAPRIGANIPQNTAFMLP